MTLFSKLGGVVLAGSLATIGCGENNPERSCKMQLNSSASTITYTMSTYDEVRDDYVGGVKLLANGAEIDYQSFRDSPSIVGTFRIPKWVKSGTTKFALETELKCNRYSETTLIVKYPQETPQKGIKYKSTQTDYRTYHVERVAKPYYSVEQKSDSHFILREETLDFKPTCSLKLNPKKQRLEFSAQDKGYNAGIKELNVTRVGSKRPRFYADTEQHTTNVEHSLPFKYIKGKPGTAVEYYAKAIDYGNNVCKSKPLTISFE